MNKSPHRISGSRWIPVAALAVIFFLTSALITLRIPMFAQSAQAPVTQDKLQDKADNRKAKFVVQPEYPELAKKNNISGTARVQALIAPDGTVKEVKVLGGSPVLAQAVVDAVKKWKYEPAPVATTAVLKFDFKPGQ